MRVPCKQPVQTKAELKHALTSLSMFYQDVHTDYRHEIEVMSKITSKTILLKRLTSCDADPCKAALLSMIGAPNKYLQMEEGKCDGLKGITNEVVESKDFIMCHSDLVEALVEGPIEEE